MIRVSITNLQKRARLLRRELIAAVRAVMAGERVEDAEIGLAFVDDERIAELNRMYLHHEGPTDVITFPLSAAGEQLAGEIVVSVETAARAARERGLETRTELALYVIHGCLHLCGHDDQVAADRRRMRRKEQRYLESLGLTRHSKEGS